MIDKISKILDYILFLFVIPSALILKLVRKVGLKRLRISRMVLIKIGVIPIIDHYYDPFFSKKDLKTPLNNERVLLDIDWNLEEQLEILNSFDYADEFTNIPINYTDELSFHFDNGSFSTGDAEYWYNMIRLKKPQTIIEIGSGHSTKIAQKAIRFNQKLNPTYTCKHICIEPYEMPWLEKLDVEVIRKKVEDIDLDIFKTLNKNDILFIDSSHIIKPQGDVLYEYFTILPILNKGVIVHIHDIFTPRDYLEEWVFEDCRFWNEQYLLEAFLYANTNWKIIGAVNYLKHNFFNELVFKCPKLTKDREPGSFYIERN